MNPVGELILVLDSGTTSTRAIVFDREGAQRAVAQKELTQHYPRPGWVEHDAGEIWERTLACARDAIVAVGGADRIACIGITNQRETVVAWDRESGEPLARAIVWQDRRTAPFCEELRAAGHEEAVQAKTGLLLDPYFSGTKMRWLLDNVPEVKAAADAGRLAFGTVESWLVYKLSGAHLSDASNASRTLLLPLEGAGWDEGLCDLFGVPVTALPEVTDNAGMLAETREGVFGHSLPICGLAGDQQAATIGQGCLSSGETKATYGTGAFVLTNMGGEVPTSRNRLLGTVLMQQGGARTYALEGSVFVAGSLIQWLRDSLGLIAQSADTEALARSVADAGGVVIVPALSGLGAPHWRPEARGLISGLSFATGRAEIARAALEAMAMQTLDLAEAFAADGAQWDSLKIDGGMSANDWMAQDLADILALPVERPANVETTALGAGMLAGVGAGLFGSLDEAANAMRGAVHRFVQEMADAVRDERITRAGGKRWKLFAPILTPPLLGWGGGWGIVNRAVFVLRSPPHCD
ncbi:MAG: glycerol kinase GlpK [Sphingomonadaceae bacterium]